MFPFLRMMIRIPPPEPMATKPRSCSGTDEMVAVPTVMLVGTVVAMISSVTPPVVTELMRPLSSARFPPAMIMTCGELVLLAPFALAVYFAAVCGLSMVMGVHSDS